MYTPTPNAVGKLSDPPSKGFAKLSDKDINAIPAGKNGYYYFKLEDFGVSSKQQPTMLVRTKALFKDTARAFGWSKNFDLCHNAGVHTCIFKKGTSAGRFDTHPTVHENTCSRWFTDFLTTSNCYLKSTKQRCFNKGLTCGHSIRDNVVIYKLNGNSYICEVGILYYCSIF